MNNIIKALESLLNVINNDKDGSFFICEEAADVIENARSIVEAANKGPFKVYVVWGGQDASKAANMQYEDKPDWSELENDPCCYEFATEDERDAFIQGCEAAEGWLDWYSMEESEYQACCEQRGC